MIRYVAILLTLLLSACQQPDFKDAAGNGHRLEELRGKWLFVNYWATWCAPCIKEIPELNEVAESHADRIVVYGVNFDGPTGDELDKQIARMKIDFPVFAKDPHQLLGIERPQVLPTTLAFSPDGEHVETLVGPQTEESLLAVTDGDTAGSG